MSDKYTILGTYNDNDGECEVWDEKKVAESLGDYFYLEESDYYWADVNNGSDHKIVAWKKSDGPTVRLDDVFIPDSEDHDWYVSTYEEGFDGKVFNPYRAAEEAVENLAIHQIGVLDQYPNALNRIEKERDKIIKFGEEWFRPIEGDLISQFEKVDDDTEESDYRYEQSRDERDSEERARRKNRE